jgi:hypothetical protein
MRGIDQLLLQLRGRVRRVQARLPGAPPPRPGAVVLRLDAHPAPIDAALPAAAGPPLGLGAWRARLTEIIRWAGPMPVTVRLLTAPPEGMAAELLRFAQRLGCPTTLETAGQGLDEEVALALLDAGLGRARLFVASLQAGPQIAALGVDPIDAAAALRALRGARDLRQAPLDVEVAVPWLRGAGAELSTIRGWATQAGADGVRVLPPWTAADAEGAAGLPEGRGDAGLRGLRAIAPQLRAMAADGQAAPGAPRRRRCGVLGQRLDLAADGAVRACPFKPPMGTPDQLPPAAWLSGDVHRQLIHSCGRTCGPPVMAALG